MFLKLLIISVILLSMAMLGMALNILIKKKGRFPAYRVGHNRDMNKLGISCVKHDEIRCHRKNMNAPVTYEPSGVTEGTEAIDKEQQHDCAGCQQLT